jgi:hypothetical protein
LTRLAALSIRRSPLSFLFRRNWTLPLLLSLLAPAASSQATGRLSGSVQDATGRALAGARVTLSLSESPVVYSSTLTNRSGMFFFGMVGAASYELVVEAANFSNQKLTGVSIDPEVETTLPPIRLTRGDAWPVVESKAPESTLQTRSAAITFPATEDQLNQLPLPRRDPLFLMSTLPGVQDNGRGEAIDGESLATTNIAYDGMNVRGSGIRMNGLGPISIPLHTDQVDEATLVTGAIDGCGCGQVAFTSPSGSNALHGSAYWLAIPPGVTAQYWADNSRNTPATTNLNQLGAKSGGALRKNRLFFFLNYEADLDNSKLTRTGSVPVQPLTSQDPEVQRVLALLPSNSSGVYRGQQDNGYVANMGTARLDYSASARNTFGASFAYTNSTRDDPADSSVFGSKPTTTIQVSSPFFSVFWRWSPTARLTNEFRVGASLPTIDMGNSLRSTFGFIAILNDPKVQVSQPMMGMDPRGREDYQRGYQDNLTWVLGKHTVQSGVWFQQYRLNTYGNNNGLLDSLSVPRYIVDNIAQGTISEVDQRFNITSSTSGYSSGSTARSKLSTYMIAPYVHDTWKLFRSLSISMGARWGFLNPPNEETGTAIIPNLPGDVSEAVYNQQMTFAPQSAAHPFYGKDTDGISGYIGLAWKPIERLPLVVRGAASESYINEDLLNDFSLYALENPFQSFNVSTDFSQPLELSKAPVTPLPTLPGLTLPALLSFANSYHQEPGPIYGVNPNLATANVKYWNLGIESEMKGFLLAVRYAGNRLEEGPRSVDRNQVQLPPAFVSAFQQVQSALLSGQPTSGFPMIPGGGLCTNLSAQNCQPDQYAISLIKTGQAGELARWYQGQGYLNNTSYYVLGNPLAPQGIYVLSHLGVARYDALQLTASRRLSRGLGLTSSYVLSKAMSNLDDYQPGAIDPYLDVHNSSLEWAPAPFNLTNAFKATVIWSVPFFKNGGTSAMGRVLSHWSVSGILMAQSGAPFSLLSGGSVIEPNGAVNQISGLGTFTYQADSSQNSVFTSLSGAQIKQFFGIHENPNGTVSYVTAPAGAFDEPAPGTIGKLQKRLFSGPGALNLNLGARKTIALNERWRAELRAEAINLSNRVNWLVGDQTYLGANGQSALFNNNVTQWNTPRTLQFSVRLSF